jgi:hypothetical protein
MWPQTVEISSVFDFKFTLFCGSLLMNLTVANKERILESLLDMGKCGHFPLFINAWIAEGLEKTCSTKKDQRRGRQILDRIIQHRCMEKRKTVVMSLSDEDRAILIRSFMQLVENRVIDARPTIQ